MVAKPPAMKMEMMEMVVMVAMVAVAQVQKLKPWFRLRRMLQLMLRPW